MVETIETVIIGAGHAGLSTSYYLKQHGREHTILEKSNKAANSWRSERWDSFTFVSPNWTFQIPGGEFDGPDPDGFMPREELVSRFENHAEKYQLPIAYNTCVASVQAVDGRGFLVRTQEREYRLHKFYREGVILLGHAWDYVDGRLILAPDLKENLTKADMSQKGMLKRFDDYFVGFPFLPTLKSSFVAGAAQSASPTVERIMGRKE